jgi:hypothetical protein
MARPRKPARLCRVHDRPNWYIRDGDTLLSTGTESAEEAESELAAYRAEKATPPKIAEVLSHVFFMEAIVESLFRLDELLPK